MSRRKAGDTFRSPGRCFRSGERLLRRACFEAEEQLVVTHNGVADRGVIECYRQTSPPHRAPTSLPSLHKKDKWRPSVARWPPYRAFRLRSESERLVVVGTYGMARYRRYHAGRRTILYHARRSWFAPITNTLLISSDTTATLAVPGAQCAYGGGGGRCPRVRCAYAEGSSIAIVLLREQVLSIACLRACQGKRRARPRTVSLTGDLSSK